MEVDSSLLRENASELSLLFVEDDIDLQEATGRFFLHFFGTVDCVDNGSKGLELYKSKINETDKPYDIVVTDVRLPGLDGVEMSREIKKLCPEQSIIFVSASNDPDDLNNGISLGISGFLKKPLELDSLKELLYKETQKIVDRKILQQHYEQIEEINMLHIDKIDASKLNKPTDIYKDLLENKENISTTWVANEIAQERLKKHFIDPEFFRTHYAIKVIDYFLGVITGENEAGNCPVIFAMLEFFKNKNLPLNDIFMICVTFKNTVSSYIFSKYSFNKYLFDEISFILDKNFEGVISNYLTLYYKSTGKKSKQESINNVKTTDQVESQDEERTVPDFTNYADLILDNDLYELQDLEEEIDSLAITATESNEVTIEDLEILGGRIFNYGRILKNYPLFSELGVDVSLLGEKFIENAVLLSEHKERVENISAMVEGFVNDLIVWRHEVFDNNIEDPNFLNKSFSSNVSTIIMYMEYDPSNDVEDDDLDDLFF